MRIVEIGAIFDLELVGPDNDANEMGVNQGSRLLDRGYCHGRRPRRRWRPAPAAERFGRGFDRSGRDPGAGLRRSRASLLNLGAQRVDDGGFERGRRQAMRRGGDAIPRLHGRCRDIVPIAHALLDGVARRQSFASFIEELAQQQRVGFEPGGARDALPVELRLNFGECLDVDDRRMLAGPGLATVIDLAEIMTIAQEMGKRTVGQVYAADNSARSKFADAGANVAAATPAAARTLSPVRDRG